MRAESRDQITADAIADALEGWGWPTRARVVRLMAERIGQSVLTVVDDALSDPSLSDTSDPLQNSTLVPNSDG